MVQISLIVPCYEQGVYLGEALNSILNQEFEHWECIIVDDGSTDLTSTLAKKWVKKDSRFKYLYQSNQGLSSARNLGIKNSTGKYIVALDADDKISPDYLLKLNHTLSNNPDLKIVYSKAEKFGIEEGPLDLPSFSLFDLSNKNMIYCSAMFQKKDWERVGGYDEKMIYGLEDWEFWISILKDGGKVKCLDFVGFYYRIKETSMLKEMDVEKRKKMLEYLSIKHADFFVEQKGSFFELESQIEEVQNKFEEKLQSEKFLLNKLFYRLFRFNIFKDIG